MKKIIAPLLLVLTLNASLVHAQITAGNPEFDQFNYTPTGSALTNFTNPNGTKWVLAGANTTAQTAYPTINSGNLTVSGLLSPAGNDVIWGSAVSGQTGGIASSDTACAVLPLTGKTTISGTTLPTNVFYSLAFQVNSGSVPTTALGVFPLGFTSAVTQTGQSTAPTTVGARLYIKTNNSAPASYCIGINKADGSAADVAWEGGNNTNAYAEGTTYFIVVEYSFSGTPSAASDTASLWVNPNPSTFGAATAPTSDPSYVTTYNIPNASTIYGGANISSTADQINGFLVRQVSSEPGSMTMDELSIGVEWADVTPFQCTQTASFSGLSSVSSAYDTTFTLTGTVSAPGPVYPAKGEGVTVTINGVTESTTINDTTGDFTINYTHCNAPLGGGPYTITYNYNGPTLCAGSDTSTTLTVTGPGAVVLYGARMYDGTTNAPAGMLYVSNAAAGDVVTVGGGTAGLAGSAVGSEAITSFSALTLGGAQASDYTLTGASGSVLIATPPISVGHPIFEPFNYTAGANLVGQMNAQGLTWYAMGNSSSQPTIQSGTLNTSGLELDSGNEVDFAGVASGTTAQLPFDAATTNSAFYGGSSYTLYYSMLFEVTETTGLSPTTPGFVVAFCQTAGTSGSAPTTGYARLYLQQDGGGFNIGINKADGMAADIAWDGGNEAPNIYGANTTYFIVAAYTFSGTPGVTNDSVSLWVDPSPSTFGAANPPAPDVTTSAGAEVGNSSPTDELSSFYIRNSNAFEPGGMVTDELSIGLSWADVTPVFSSFPITSESVNTTAGTITLTWQSISGVSYHVAGSTSISAATSWTQVGSEVTATGTSTTTTVPMGSYNFFDVVSP